MVSETDRPKSDLYKLFEDLVPKKITSMVPGPYSAYEEHMQGYRIESVSTNNKGPAKLATVPWRGPETEGTARLLAASFTLLEACKYALERIQRAGKYGPNMVSSRDLCIEDAEDLLKMAIEKAEK